MKIIVLAKEVADTYTERKLNLETGLADRDANDRVLDEITERANEVAVAYAESNPGTEIVLVSVGPDSASTSLRKGLAMGADRAVHVVDDALLGADLTLTAEVLAKAIELTGFDLVITGDVSTDGSAGLIPAMLAERLGVPNVTGLSTVELTDTEVRGGRETDGGTATVAAALPAVISITERLPDPRLPGFKGIMSAKKKPFETLTLADLGIDADADVPRSIMIAVSEKPTRDAGIKIVDEGHAGEQLAEFLVQNKLV
jgi:electron transfer flavoprotein beta subunit